MLLNILLVVVAIVAGLLLFAATRPDGFRLERQTTIKAPADQIFAHLNDFRAWAAWSPWEKIDPAMQRTHSGAASGVGAAYAWDGPKVGAGRMEILETAPPQSATIKLDFTRPFEAHNTIRFTLTAAGDSTTVNWAMEGKNNFMAKVMGLFLNMDKVVGKDFEAGLANLKALAEQR